MNAPRDLSVREFQRLPQVVDRVKEFCGLDAGARSRCVYVTGMGALDGQHVTWGHVSFRAPECLEELLGAGNDVARSLWDTESLLVYLDLDYRNEDLAGEPYLHPADCFLKLEPVYNAVWRTLDDLRIPMLDLVTGAGYGFVGSLPLESPTVDRLAALVSETPTWHGSHLQRRPAFTTLQIHERVARAHQGLGLVLEGLMHRVLARAASSSLLPVVVNNVDVGIGPRGREAISIDLTHMGDPLDVRHMRVAFGAYQKHRLRPDLVGNAASRLPPLAVVPRRRRPLLEVLENRTLVRAPQWAKTPVAIPNVEEGVARLLADYEASDLASWHRDFERIRPDPPEQWPRTYFRLEPGSLPPCVAACLEYPNDLLLKPSYVQLLVRTLMARGWHPRHVAGLVRAHYSRSDLWDEHWRRADPSTRADFDVRVFAGLIAMGLDEGMDFNCVSTQEKGMCTGHGCHFDLRQERDRLLAARKPS